MLKSLISKLISVRVSPPRQSLVSNTAEPARASHAWTTVEHSPEHHAEWLLRWLLERSESNTLLYPDVLSVYREMARELNWTPRPWNPVGRHLTKLLGGRKNYKWVTSIDGSRHRLRVYRIPETDSRASQGGRATALHKEVA